MKNTTLRKAILIVLTGACLETTTFAKSKKMTEVTEQCWSDGKGGQFCQEVERKEVNEQETPPISNTQSSDRGMPVGNSITKSPSNNSEQRDFTVSSANKSSSMKKLALVIGNSNYSEAPLKNPVNDARSIARTLQNLGFTVIAKENLTQEGMNEAVREFGDKLGEGMIGLFYFAGHGMQVKGKNYLIPVNSGIKREDEVPFSAFDANRLLAKMDSAHNGLNLVILDACRNNPFERSFRSGGEGLAPMDAPSGTLIAYAAKPGMKSKDSNSGGNNGLYTGTLLKYLATPNLTIESLFKKVRIEVKNSSGGEQVSWEEGGLESDFCFAGCNGNSTLLTAPPPSASLQQMASPPVEQVEPSTPVTTPAANNSDNFELTFWNSIKDSNNPDDFKAYLAKYPNGQFEALAHNRMGKSAPQTAQQTNQTTPVASTSTQSNSRYQIMGSDGGIVKDNQTGLMWMRCSVGQTWNGTTCVGELKRMDWNSAMSYKTTYAGYSDWRLPTKKELESLVYCSDGNYGRPGNEEQPYYVERGYIICATNKDKPQPVTKSPTIDVNYFPNNTPNWFWSSSPDASLRTYSWSVSFSSGYSDNQNKNKDYYIQLVR